MWLSPECIPDFFQYYMQTMSRATNVPLKIHGVYMRMKWKIKGMKLRQFANPTIVWYPVWQWNIYHKFDSFLFLLDKWFSLSYYLKRHFFIEYECGSDISDDCQSEFNNHQNNGALEKFYYRCSAEGGHDPLRLRCSLCCPERPPGVSEDDIYTGKTRIWFFHRFKVKWIEQVINIHI